MFKALTNGYRTGGRSSRTARVNSSSMGHGRPIADEMRRRPAFLPATPQEQGYDSNTPRVDETA